MEKIKAYYQTAGRVSVDFIVIHWVNGSLDSCIRTFTDGVRQASAHYGVEDQRVVSFVDDENTAWSLGNWDANQRSISVEHSAQPGRPATDATYETSIRLIAGLMVKHGLTPSAETIRPHNDFSATQCPGTMDLARIIEGVKTFTTIKPQSSIIKIEDDIMAALTDEEQRELLGNTRIIIGMIDNVAGFLNGTTAVDEETMLNARKLVNRVIDGQ